MRTTSQQWSEHGHALPAGHLPDDAYFTAHKAEVDRLMRSDSAAALAVAREMAHAAKRTGRPSHRALALLAEANVRAVALAEYGLALELYDEASDTYMLEGSQLGQAIAQIGRVAALANLGRSGEALAAGTAAAAVLAASDEHLRLATLKMNLGNVHGRLGRDQTALQHFDDALALCTSHQAARPLMAAVQQDRSVVLRNLGDFESSERAAREAYRLFLDSGQTIEAARAEQSLALNHSLQSRYAEALGLLDRVRDVFFADGRLRDAALVDLFMADCYLHVGEPEQVLKRCRSVRETFESIGSHFEIGQALLDEASALRRLGRVEQALTCFERAHATFSREGNATWSSVAELRLAEMLVVQGEAAAAVQRAGAAEKVFARAGLRLRRAEARLVLAHAHLTCHQLPDARSHAAAALRSARARGAPWIEWQAHHVLGQAAERAGDWATACAQYRRATARVDLVRARTMLMHRSGLMQEAQAPYRSLVRLLVERGQADEALDAAERARARALLDMLAHRIDMRLVARDPADQELVHDIMQLRRERDRLLRRMLAREEVGLKYEQIASAEAVHAAELAVCEESIASRLEQLLVRNAAYASDISLWQATIRPIAPLLARDEALVEYFADEAGWLALVVRPDGATAVRLPTSNDQIDAWLRKLRLNFASVAAGASETAVTNVRVLLNQICEAVWRPLSSCLQYATRVIIVPHAQLHYVPFHCLSDGSSHLIERYQVSYLPAASLLAQFRDMQARHAVGTYGPALVMAHSDGGRLSHVHRESATVARLLGTSPVIDVDAKRDRLAQAGESASVIHLAAHGDFRAANPLFSSIRMADGELTTLDVFNLRLNAQLVTLSACETGRSVVAGGDELIGLARAFVYAGARSLVLTLWAVSDEATCQLMETFYAALVKGQGIPQSLRLAQLDLLHGGPTGYSHPYYWSAFYHVGDPSRSRLTLGG